MCIWWTLDTCKRNHERLQINVWSYEVLKHFTLWQSSPVDFEFNLHILVSKVEIIMLLATDKRSFHGELRCKDTSTSCLTGCSLIDNETFLCVNWYLHQFVYNFKLHVLLCEWVLRQIVLSLCNHTHNTARPLLKTSIKPNHLSKSRNISSRKLLWILKQYTSSLSCIIVSTGCSQMSKIQQMIIFLQC